ncbi:hypothetical protein NLJ89_g2026 [Agrocybe chaxingu]|uniref:Uncharacterized protein n=1 Tax=Agrocybe chaxingu TaxID=84603 RepID=A0A9W8MYY8_9AGAR|nr:hypothetical protein NLJ89_g2026 [Agrocybe chaxingu]
MSYPKAAELEKAANAAKSTDALSNEATEGHNGGQESALRRSSDTQATLRQSRRFSAPSDATDGFKSTPSLPIDVKPPSPFPEVAKLTEKPSRLESAAGSTPRPTIVLPLPHTDTNTKQPPLRSAQSEGELPSILRHHQSIVTFLLAEKHIHTLVSPKRRRRRRRQSGLRNFSLMMILQHPFSIILAQLLILGLAWTFFIVVLFQGPLMLSPSVASAARNNPQVLVFVVTLIATVISTISSFFFGLSIRLIVNHYLATRSMSIFSLGTSMEILNRNFVFDTQHRWWTTAAILMFLVNSTLIASWSALIMPVPVIVEALLPGLPATEGLGFSQDPGVINLILLPITCISLASLTLVFVVLFQRMFDADSQHDDDEQLDDLSSKTDSRRASQLEPSPDTTNGSPTDNRRSTATTSTQKTPLSTGGPPTILTRAQREHSAHLAHEIASFDLGNPLHLLAAASAGWDYRYRARWTGRGGGEDESSDSPEAWKVRRR